MADMAGTQKLTRCGCGSFRTMSYKDGRAISFRGPKAYSGKCAVHSYRIYTKCALMTAKPRSILINGCKV